MANSLMFQRSPQPVEGYDDPQLSNFYGEALPLVKRGIPVGITHLENVVYEDTWKNVKVLLMSYSNMKPLNPEAHKHLAQWVKNGGVIVYSGRDDDPYQNVYEWWNQNGNTYTAPSQHLFSLMQMPEKAEDGVYEYGKGRVYVIRKDPKEFVMSKGGDEALMKVVEKAYPGTLDIKNSLTLERGAYTLASVIADSPAGDASLTLKGSFINLFDPALPVCKDIDVSVGEQAFLYNINKVIDKKRPQVLAAASRQYDEQVGKKQYTFVAKSPKNTSNIMRILLPKKPKSVYLSTQESPYGKVMLKATTLEWDPTSKTLLLGFENDPNGVRVEINW